MGGSGSVEGGEGTAEDGGSEERREEGSMRIGMRWRGVVEVEEVKEVEEEKGIVVVLLLMDVVNEGVRG